MLIIDFMPVHKKCHIIAIYIERIMNVIFLTFSKFICNSIPKSLYQSLVAVSDLF